MHPVQALPAEDLLGVLPRLSAAPKEGVGEAMEHRSPTPVAGVRGVACQAERRVWDIRSVAEAMAVSKSPSERACSARFVAF